jgi:hypothetical protein
MTGRVSGVAARRIGIGVGMRALHGRLLQSVAERVSRIRACVEDGDEQDINQVEMLGPVGLYEGPRG